MSNNRLYLIRIKQIPSSLNKDNHYCSLNNILYLIRLLRWQIYDEIKQSGFNFIKNPKTYKTASISKSLGFILLNYIANYKH